MRVQVDVGACEANGVCAAWLPEVFGLDDDDNLHVLAVTCPRNCWRRCSSRLRSCPKAALRVTE